MKPLIPAKLAALAAALSVILGVAGHMLPEQYAAPAAILAFICAGLAGLALPSVRFLAHKPLVSAALVPVLASASALLASVAGTLPGPIGLAVYSAALVCAFLAGSASPPPMQVAPPVVVPEPEKAPTMSGIINGK